MNAVCNGIVVPRSLFFFFYKKSMDERTHNCDMIKGNESDVANIAFEILAILLF